MFEIVFSMQFKSVSLGLSSPKNYQPVWTDVFGELWPSGKFKGTILSHPKVFLTATLTGLDHGLFN